MRQRGTEDVLSANYDHTRLLQHLEEAYAERNPCSKAAHDDARQVLIDGYSHGARAFKPFPFRIARAQGAHVTDIDGHTIVDLWQGHYANILGHNPAIIRTVLADALATGEGLQTGMLEERQAAYARFLASALDSERVRLTTSGTLATMYAMMMARAFTGRCLVVKVAGGWHGANPLALKGVARNGRGYDHVDSAGVFRATDQEIIVTRFNDVDALADLFARLGEQIACFILEPCPSKSGFIPATGSFMRAARDLTARHGALLILDEVITAFRFCDSGVQRLYGIKADLTTLGKIIGGGMPISAVAGRADVMATIGAETPKRVWFNGGTFSAHPLSLLAGQTMVEYLTTHKGEIYPSLAAKGERLRRGMERVFADRGVLARCTGHGNGTIKGSSLGTVYFPLRDDLNPTCAEDLTDPALCDVAMRERILKLGLVLRDVNVIHGLGALSNVHGEKEIEHILAACDAFAQCLAKTR